MRSVFTLLCYFLYIWSTGRTVCRWLRSEFTLASNESYFFYTVGWCFMGEMASLALSGTHTVSSLLCCVFSRLRRYNSAPIFSFSEAFNLRSGIGLAFPHTVSVVSTVVQTGACLWPPGRIERKCVFLPFALSLHFGAMREENETHLSWVSLFSQPFMCPSFCFYLSNTHVHKPPERCAHAAPSIFRRALNGWLAFACIDWVHVCPIFQRSWWLY